MAEIGVAVVGGGWAGLAAALALKQVGLEADVPFCAQVAKSAAVPVLRGRVGEALIFKRA